MLQKLEMSLIPETKLPQQTLGAPMPLLINTDTKTILLYYGYGNDDLIVVTWLHSQLALFSPYSSDHPILSEVSHTDGSNFIVHNSPLHAEYQILDSYRHHIMVFHDSIFECMAQDFSAHKSEYSYLETITKIFEQK